MKSLHRPDLYAWSVFDTARNLDFNGTLWTRSGGNIAVDPMELSEHDRQHVAQLGGLDWILLTNADHVRDTVAIAQFFDARIAAPAAEREAAPLAALELDHLMEPDEVLGCGIRCVPMRGSKGFAGELAFLLPEEDTLICGDLIRGQRAGSLNLLPDEKLTDKDLCIASVSELLQISRLEAILVGDGQSIFRNAAQRLTELLPPAH
ncbi:MAG TPA: MBL fold metallo-hydrolase [Deltaproteobacteria bacterium]|nr:MBL fold metallo-hydrolase [Deltaproteobacteria bacterium]